MSTTAEELAQAKTYHKAGDLRGAEQFYRRVLAADAAHVEALYLLGAACHGLRQSAEAKARLAQVVRLKPDHAEAHHHLGVVLAEQGQLDEAVASFQQASRLRPNSIEMSNNLRRTLAEKNDNLGNAWTAQGQLAEAAACYRRALDALPNHAPALGNLGHVLTRQGTSAEAATCFRQLLELKPNSAEAHNDLGVVLTKLKKFTEAVGCFRRAVELRPDFHDAMLNLNFIALMVVVDPYDRAERARLADLTFDLKHTQYPPGTVTRSRFLLSVIRLGFPTRKLTTAYFENLELLFESREKRTRPGQVVLGLGTGRCGSTTLAAAFAGVNDACATHENPPFIDWEPQEDQVRFHIDRLRLLTNYHALVFDAAHWWLNVLCRFFDEFPDCKAVGLIRETKSCVNSFLSAMGRGPGSVNHWAPPGNGIWATDVWDPVYPNIAVPVGLLPDADTAKAAMIERYVTEYNETLRSLADRFPERLLLIPTNELSEHATAARLSALVGMPLEMPSAKLNVGTTFDGILEQYNL